MMEHNKLVRDKIPEIIKADNCVLKIRILSKEDRIKYLKEKAVEEAKELMEADPENLLLEMADVMEVVFSLAEEFGISPDEIEEKRKERAEERGRFKEGIFLISTKKKLP